ncbi:MAG: carbohydrate kinase family protein [Anaerolineae bacterium]|nr:carbohydrate kinase family protein [Anaerolineae bacterium]
MVLGNPVLDYVLQIAQLPSARVTHQKVHALYIGPGGAANLLIGAARLGLPVQALGIVGDDNVGRRLRRWLDAEEVDTRMLISLPGNRTPRVFILTTPQGSQTFLGYHPKGYTVPGPPADWQAAISQAIALYCDGWSCGGLGISFVQQAVEQAHKAGVAVFFDLGPQMRSCPAGQLATILRNTTALTLTEEEARAYLPGPLALPDLASALRERGPQLVVIKRGAQGSYIQCDDEAVLHPGFSVPVRDSTAAGDAVSAALIWGWLHRCPLPQLADLLNAAGAVAVQRLGGGFNMPRLAEIKALLQERGKVADFM